MKKVLLAGVAVFGLTLAATSAQAALVINTANPAGSISNADNTGVGPIFGQASVAGYYGSNITVNAQGTVEYTFLGYEAASGNTFSAPGGSHVTGAPSGSVWQPASGTFLSTQNLDIGDLLDFIFTTNEGAASPKTVKNGDPNVDAPVGVVAPPSFFATFGDASKVGDVLYLFLDDRGGGDDNHDDMVIKVTFKDAANVPEPASLALFGAGLLGLGLARRFRRQAA